MAHIRDVLLVMKKGERGSRFESAHITGSVDFTSREIQENLSYAIWVAINEQDDPTIYHFYTNGQAKPEVRKTLQGNPPGDLDDDVQQFFLHRTIRPDGRSTVPIEISRNLDVGDQEDDNEEYIATVFAIPEITYGYALSNVQSINLG